jgi:tetratricopeptide (TPR) repeat protein
MGRHEDALADFRSAFEESSVGIDQKLQFAADLLQVEMYDLANQLVNEAIALDPSSGPAFALRGDVMWRVKDYAGALSDFDQAVALGYDRLWTLPKRAFCLEMLGEASGALNDLQELLQSQPDNEWARKEVDRIVVHPSDQTVAEVIFSS